MADGKKDERPIMEYANARIRETAGDLTLDPGEGWGFFCECDDDACREIVYLSLLDYELLRDRGDAVLAPGHRDTRRRARRLQEEAAALRAEAIHAAARAAKAILQAEELKGRSIQVCAHCGCGAFADALPERCPMCGVSDWRPL